MGARKVRVTLFGSTAVYYDQGNNFGTPPQKGNGNIIDEGTRLYAYDAFNRLITVSRKSDGATIGQYIYDAHGRRVQKTVGNGGLAGTIADGATNYLYDANQCVEEQTPAGSTTRPVRLEGAKVTSIDSSRNRVRVCPPSASGSGWGRNETFAARCCRDSING
jgi:YD repeat-containing protein